MRIQNPVSLSVHQFEIAIFISLWYSSASSVHSNGDRIKTFLCNSLLRAKETKCAKTWKHIQAFYFPTLNHTKLHTLLYLHKAFRGRCQRVETAWHITACLLFLLCERLITAKCFFAGLKCALNPPHPTPPHPPPKWHTTGQFSITQQQVQPHSFDGDATGFIANQTVSHKLDRCDNLSAPCHWRWRDGTKVWYGGQEVIIQSGPEWLPLQCHSTGGWQSESRGWHWCVT